jgi:hypothetical protein
MEKPSAPYLPYQFPSETVSLVTKAADAGAAAKVTLALIRAARVRMIAVKMFAR